MHTTVQGIKMACTNLAADFEEENIENSRDFTSCEATIHIIDSSPSLKKKGKRKVLFWKNDNHKKKKNGIKKNKKNKKRAANQQQFEIIEGVNRDVNNGTVNATFELTPATCDFDESSEQDSSSEDVESIKGATLSSPRLTAEPSVKRNRQNGPIQIAWPDTTTPSGLTINVKPICRILSSPQIASLPVAIFSINGITRGGKSFLLNQAVKFLKFGKSHPNDWIDQQSEMRFDWSFRMEAVTEGIQVWPEPFILEDSTNSGKKLALILLDNQGLEDTQTTTHVTYKLFCLSNLLSSVFTYCDIQAHAKSFLESLHTFMEFTKSVEHDGRTKNECSENTTYTFGKLILLFRDFRFVKDFACDDGCAFFDKIAPAEKNLYSYIFNGDTQRFSQVVRDKRNALLQFYDDILVGTMIGPGNKEPNNTDRLHSSTWDPDFKKGIIKFVETIFSHQFFSQANKKISDQEIPAHVLTKYIKNWAKIISEKNYNISDITGLEASRNLYYHNKIEESMKEYMATMDKYKTDPNMGDIGEILVDTIKSIEWKYWSDCEYGDWKGFYLEKLQKRISDFSNEQSVFLHFVIKGKRKQAKRRATYTNVGGSALLVGGTATAGLASGGVFIAGVLLASSGIIGVAGASGLLGWWRFKDRQEKKAVRKISDKVDSQLGIHSDFNFKEKIRQIKQSTEKKHLFPVLTFFNKSLSAFKRHKKRTNR